MKKIEVKENFYYYAFGLNPRLLIHSGTHGDEYEVIDLVEESLLKHEKELPSFIFVPQVSPSAVRLKKRKNVSGIDMNRQFYSDSLDNEVQANIEIIKDNKFDLFVSFHEDPGISEYYLYDVGYQKGDNGLVLRHNQLLKKSGVGLLNGVDDPDDPHLGYELVEGYIKMHHPDNYQDDGTISSWVLNRHIAEDYLLPEIPGKLDLKNKRFVVESFFQEVIIKTDFGA